MPDPQLHALEVALLRAKPGRGPPEPRAIAAGLLRTLRELAARSPVVLAIDDVQWLDRSSANALAFAARRLEHDAVAFLLTERSGTSSQLTGTLEARLERLDVGALSLGATRWLLSDRLGFFPSRHVLRLRAVPGAPRSGVGGRPDEAETWAEQAIAASDAQGWRWSLLEALRARGLAALLAHDAARAAESLRTVWEHTEREGVAGRR